MSFRFSLTSAPGIGSIDAHRDFVETDMAALAHHMQRCKGARDRLSSLRGGLQKIHGLAASRLVTLGCLAAVLGLALLHVA